MPKITKVDITDDTEYLADLRNKLQDLVELCRENKDYIKDMGNWEIVHNLEFQLDLAAEKLTRRITEIIRK